MSTKNTAKTGGYESFAELSALIRAADGLSLAQVCALSGLEPSTIQNWIKRGFVPHPDRKRYDERHLARILLIDAMRDGMLIERVGALMRYINGDADDTADDIIGEQALYELFRRAVKTACEQCVPPDRVGEIVKETMRGEVSDHTAAERLVPALTIMVNAYLAARYKNEADRLYEKMILH